MSDHRIFKLITLFLFILGLFPRKLLLFFSDALATIWFWVDKRHRNVVMNNVSRAYPGRFSEKELRAFAMKNFRHTAGILFNVIWSRSLTPEKLFDYFTIKGTEHLEPAFAKGRGVVAVTCHMGVFELLIPAVAKIDLKAYALYRKLDFKPAERLMLETRERFNAVMIPLRGASKKIDGILKDNQLVATLLDQNVDWYKGVFVDFFNRPACTNSGLAKLVLRAKPAVLPAFIRKDGDGFVLEILPEIPIIETGDPIKDIEKNTQAYASAVEKMVRQSPVEYFWVHNRWKTKPYCLLDQSTN